MSLAMKPAYFIHAGVGGFLPAVKQIANVAALPGIVGVRANRPCTMAVLCYHYDVLYIALSGSP